MAFTLHSTPNTALQAIKEQLQTYLGGADVVATEKIKLLLNKKPIPGSKKTVSEALEGSDTTGEVEMGVMIMGGAPDPPPQAHPPRRSSTAAISISAPASEKAAVEAVNQVQEQKPETTPMEGVETSTSEPVQPGEASGQSLLETAEFWTDLQGFLEQRIRSSEDAEHLRGMFERAWRSSRAAP